MRYVALKNVKPGMCLAYDVYDSYGRTLAGVNSPITEKYIERLEKFGFDGLYIQDKLSEDIDIEPVISPRLRTEGLASVRDQDIDKCMDVAKRIVEEILTKGSLSLDLTDLRSYDDYTYAHSVNVAVISCTIGMGYHMKEEDLANLVMASLLHDFGKLSIPSEILNKPGRLTREEYEIIKTHSQISFDLIKERWDVSAQVKNAVLLHHKNMDGTGYPEDVDPSELTQITKILHVADVYDALISKRPYKEPYSPKEASEYMMGGCGILFDQETVEVLLKYVPLYAKGTDAVLSDGRKGIIFENKGMYNLRPIVKLLDGTLVDLTAKENLSIGVKCIRDEEQEADEEFENARKEMIKGVPHYKIMAVDDMKPNLQMLQEILGSIYDLVLVKSGFQALKYFEKNPAPDLILMDIDMPEMNGIEAAKNIKKMSKDNIPLIFVTSLCDKETVMKCRDLNAEGYIIRPYKPVYIKSEIKRILERRSEIE